jgi:hypothetical protein
VNPRAIVDETIRHRQLWLFAALCVLLIVSAVVIPNDAAFTRGIRILLAFVSIVSFSLAASLGYYFRDAWKKQPKPDRRAYLIWLSFETVVGVPLAICVLLFGCLCVKVIIFG